MQEDVYYGKIKMNKKVREVVYNKYDGHCAYCGKSIEYKDMQVDHIRPKRMRGTDDITNLNPSCRRCNHYKRALKLEDFRKVWLGELHTRLLNTYNVKVALDYGIISEIVPFDRVFYFEKVRGSNENM